MPVAQRKTQTVAKVRNDNALDYQLTKSKYCTGLQCAKALHLTIHNPKLASPVDESKQQRFDYGTLVGEEATKHYPGGKMIEADHFHRDEAIQQTQTALKENASAIFEAAFFWERTLVRIDILRNNLDGTWDVIEVKSSTRVKDEHIPDMAIQRYIVEKCGVKIRHSFLKHINNECTFPDLTNLFTDTDCTEQVLKEIKNVPENLKQMFSVLDGPHVPETKIGPHCDEPYECGFKAHCWKAVPDYSVFELTGVWSSTKFDLYNKGFTLITDIPDGQKIARSKPEQVVAVRTGKPVIAKAEINKWLSQLSFPLFFLDFETIAPPIPKFPGTRPYQQVPFQFSCHIQRTEGGEIEHIDFLADSAEDPRQAFVEKLVKCLETEGTVVSYNAKFEKSVIESLAKTFVANRNELLSMTERFVDLLDVFRKHFFHRDFRGSNSIKATLPVLVPKMNYDDLVVCNGTVAQVHYERMVAMNTPGRIKDEIRRHLLEYCGQDTLAMVEIYKSLKQLIKK